MASVLVPAGTSSDGLTRVVLCWSRTPVRPFGCGAATGVSGPRTSHPGKGAANPSGSAVTSASEGAIPGNADSTAAAWAGTASRPSIMMERRRVGTGGNVAG